MIYCRGMIYIYYTYLFVGEIKWCSSCLLFLDYHVLLPRKLKTHSNVHVAKLYRNDSPAQRQDTGTTCCNIVGPDSSSDDDRGNRSQGELGLPAHVNHTSNSFWGFLRFTVRNSQICSEQGNEALQSNFLLPLACVQVCSQRSHPHGSTNLR